MTNSRWRSVLMALGAWAIGSVLVVGGYAAWTAARATEFRWDLARDAVIMTLPLALVLAWRDRPK